MNSQHGVGYNSSLTTYDTKGEVKSSKYIYDIIDEWPLNGLNNISPQCDENLAYTFSK